MAAIKLDDAHFAASLETIYRTGQSAQLKVHVYLFNVAASWADTGDVRPAVSRVNMLLEKLPKGLRHAAVKQYVAKYFGFLVNPETRQFVHGKTKGSDLDLATLKNKRWWEDTKEPEPYLPISDSDKLLAQLLKKYKTDRAKLGDKSVVSAERVAALEAMLQTA